MERHCPKRGSDGRSSPSPFENSTAQVGCAVFDWLYPRVIPPLLFSSGFRFRLGGVPYWAFVLVDGPGGALSYKCHSLCIYWSITAWLFTMRDRLGASFLAFTAGDAAGFAGFAGGGALLLAGAART